MEIKDKTIGEEKKQKNNIKEHKTLNFRLFFLLSIFFMDKTQDAF